MNSTYIVTFIGDDRPGLVETLAQVVSDHDGNWLESRLSQLAGKFAGLIEISLPTSQANALEDALKGLDSQGLSVRVTACDEPGLDSGAPVVVLNVIGPDRPGIVREISAELSSQAFNILNMDSRITIAPMSSEHLFEAIIDAQAPTNASHEQLLEKLDVIADHMTLDISVENA